MLLICCASLITGCHKGSGSAVPDSRELSQHPGWTAEKFKNDYTIQFPSRFEGSVKGFEGNVFAKQDVADSLYFSYAFCSPTFCSDFGDTLSGADRTTITGVFPYAQAGILLTHRTNFTDSGTLTAIFYYDEASLSDGKLFWKDGDVFKEALNVRYAKAALPEVLEILGTIRTR